MCVIKILPLVNDTLFAFLLLTDKTPHIVQCNSIMLLSVTEQNSIVSV